MEGLRRRGAAIAEVLTAGSEARITCANGSDLRLGLGDREAIPDAGDLTAPGAFGNLPCGEGFIAPIEGSGEGTLVVDGGDRDDRPPRRAGQADDRGRAPGRCERRRGRAPDGAARRGGGGGHQRRRARHRHKRAGGPHRRGARGREDPRQLPCRLRRLGGDRRHRPGPGPSRLRRDEAGRERRRRAGRPRRRAAGRGRAAGRCALAVPNFSEGRDPAAIGAIAAAFARGAELLDRHTDPVHNRTVVHARRRRIGAARGADRRRRAPASSGSTCPHTRASTRASARSTSARWSASTQRRRGRARELALEAAAAIGELGVPVFLYGELASAPGAPRARLLSPRRPRRARASGCAAASSTPDFGPAEPHPSAGATLVTRAAAARGLQPGARQRRSSRSPRAVAAELRESGGGLAGVRALAIDLGERAQVSTNVHDPVAVPLAAVIERVRELAAAPRRRAGGGRGRRPRPGGGARRLARRTCRSQASTRPPRAREPARSRPRWRAGLVRCLTDGPDEEEAPPQASRHADRTDRHAAGRAGARAPARRRGRRRVEALGDPPRPGADLGLGLSTAA